MKTILKWAGNKSKVMPQITSYFPVSFSSYVEAFAGSLGSFINSGIDPKIHNVHLNDSNEEIISFYEYLKKDWEKVVSTANQFKRNEKSFYEIRSWDKEEDWNSRCGFEKAARTLYLNKHSFNGLYRTNKKTGHYNSPYCKNEKKGNLVDKDVVESFLSKIENVTFYKEDFNTFLERDFGTNALYYFDPPYVDLKNPNLSFSGYQSEFGLEQQIHLESWTQRLSNSGHNVVVSNSDCQTTRLLYRNYEIHQIQAKRNISSKVESRKFVSEIVVVA